MAPSQQSALTRALTGKKPSTQEPPDGSSHSGSSASSHLKVPQSAFPCLYQEGSGRLSEAADVVAEEIDEDVAASYRRTSVDTPRRASHRGSLVMLLSQLAPDLLVSPHKSRLGYSSCIKQILELLVCTLFRSLFRLCGS